MPRAVADPLFPSTLRAWRSKRGLSLRRLADLTHHGKSFLHDLETGARTPSRDVAARLDDVLEASGELVALIAAETDPDARIAHAVANGGPIDSAAVNALATRLADYRTLEDQMGGAAVIPAATGNLATVEGLLRQAHGPHRPSLVCVGAQWAQWAGWLHLARGRSRPGTEHLDRALEWAVEIGDEDLMATVLSFKGYAAGLAGLTGPMIGLTEAALRGRNIYIGQRAYDEYQLARGYTLVGDGRKAREQLKVATDLTDAAVEESGDPPPWHYYRTRAFFQLEAGLVSQMLGEHDRAAELLASGLAGLPEDMRKAEWTGPYRQALAAVSAGE